MVGVPRSKGCVRCRKQKKGCDLKKPTCSNCARISSTCIYEARKVQFIPSTTTTTNVQSNALTKTAKSQAPVQPWCLDKTALELEAEDAFWTAYLPHGGRDPTVGLESVSWSPLVRRLAQQDGLTRLAFQALSLTALGRLRDDKRLLRQGTELYTRALRRMNGTLKQPERARTDHVLATAQLLSTYEIFRGDVDGEVSTQGADWQRHINGSLELIDLRQKDGAMTADSWELLRYARESAIMSEGILGRPNKPSSSTDTTTIGRPTVDVQNELFDLLFRTPQLLNDIDRCLQKLTNAKDDESKQLAIEECVAVLQIAADLARELHAWEINTFVRCQAGEITGRVPDTYMSPDKQNLFAVCRDHGYGLFRTVMFYCWAAVPCYAKAWLTYRYLLQYAGFEAIEKLADLPLLPTYMDPHPYALHICTNISHFFRPEAGLWGAQQAVLPMGTALFYFAAHNSFQSQEPRQMMAEFAASKGATVVAEFVRSVAALAAPEGYKGDMDNPNKLITMARQWFGFHYTDPPS